MDRDASILFVIHVCGLGSVVMGRRLGSYGGAPLATVVSLSLHGLEP